MPSTQACCQEKASPLHRTSWNIYKTQFNTDPGSQPKCKRVVSFYNLNFNEIQQNKKKKRIQIIVSLQKHSSRNRSAYPETHFIQLSTSSFQRIPKMPSKYADPKLPVLMGLSFINLLK